MNEPKRRGRPPKAKPVVEQLPNSVPHINGYVELRIGDTPVELTQSQLDVGMATLAKSIDHAVLASNDDRVERAQAYAMRVWKGQSVDLKRTERIERIKRALADQGLPTDGVKYPGGHDDDDWTEEDSAPVTWRKGGV